MSDHNRQEAIEKLRELISDIDIAMFTTVDQDGSMRSRPMSTQDVEFDGDLWFFSRDDSGKMSEITHEKNVNVSYADTDDQKYVSVSGKAYISHDRAKMEEFWNPMYKAWFPDGLEDPNIALIRVDVTGAEYWDSSANVLVHLAGFAKAVATGEQYHPGDNEKLDL